MRATYREHIGAIKQCDFIRQVVLNTEFNPERSRADKIDRGRIPELGS
jgi:hypothetical protein